MGLSDWNALDGLDSEEELLAFLDEAYKSGDEAFIEHCENIARKARENNNVA